MGKTNNFSIIIPFKSGKKYLLDCLLSVLAQDYPHFNIIVLADNTSNIDDSLDAVHAIQNSKISVQVSNQNLDILQNWGRIKDLPKNEYMTILGYDDLLEKTFLSTINELINKEPEASLYHTHFNYINNKSEFIKICQPLTTRLNASEYLEHALNETIDIMATGYVFKSSDYNAIGGIPTQYSNLIYADLQLWLALTKNSYLAVDNSVQFSFRIHESTTKTSKDKILLDAFLLFLDYLNQLKNESSNLAPIIEKFGKRFTESTTKAIAHRLLRTPKAIRKGLTIDEIITKIDEKSKLLGINYAPLQINSIRIAKLIEAIPLLNNLFLLFKKVYKKPVL
ncbi:MAG: glycosyltransferase family 2 protein [Chitinophagia bacterium]|nr:glycosyltransferase family 2 protein [Chitinophagia bacterium]